MSRNMGVFAASALQPVVFKNDKNAVCFIHLGPPPLYRSLGEVKEG